MAGVISFPPAKNNTSCHPNGFAQGEASRFFGFFSLSVTQLPKSLRRACWVDLGNGPPSSRKSNDAPGSGRDDLCTLETNRPSDGRVSRCAALPSTELSEFPLLCDRGFNFLVGQHFSCTTGTLARRRQQMIGSGFGEPVRELPGGNGEQCNKLVTRAARHRGAHTPRSPNNRKAVPSHRTPKKTPISPIRPIAEQPATSEHSTLAAVRVIRGDGTRGGFSGTWTTWWGGPCVPAHPRIRHICEP